MYGINTVHNIYCVLMLNLERRLQIYISQIKYMFNAILIVLNN